MSLGQACENCRFWVEGAPSWFPDRRTCRRGAPEQSRNPSDYYQTPVWPATKADDWCGEWSLK